MGYAIRYGEDTKQEIKLKKTVIRKRFSSIMIITVLLLILFWPPGQAFVRGLFFPWLDDSTADAFGEMLHQIGEGTTVSVALVDFCKSVIENAEIPV